MANKKSPTSKITFQGIGKPSSVHGYTAPPPVYGCTDDDYLEFDPLANIDDGSCSTLIVYGCMVQTDPITGIDNFNYDSLANVDDGSCYPIILGCMDNDPNTNGGVADNYITLTGDPQVDVNTDDGSCTYNVYGCMDSLANNYNSLATVNDGSCTYDILGCMDDGYCTDNPNHFDPNHGDWISSDYHLCQDSTGNSYISPYSSFQSINYDSTATIDDGSCTYSGCTDPNANNYSPFAQVDDGSCCYGTVSGCTNSLACNYNPCATIDDNSCLTDYGCTDTAAFNYDTSATCDDGSCITTLPLDNVPNVTLELNSHTSFSPTGPSNWLGNGSNQNIEMLAAPNTGSYPPDNYSFTVDFSDVTPYGGSSWNTYARSGTWDNSLGYNRTLATNDDQYTGRHNYMPTTSGTITATWTFEWENGNGGTVIHTITQVPIILEIVVGCTDPNAFNYTLSTPPTNWEDASCVPYIYGCTDTQAINGFGIANIENGSCLYSGCTNLDADNTDYFIHPNPTFTDPVTGNVTIWYTNPILADYDDGSCLIPGLHFNPINPDITVWNSDEDSYELTDSNGDDLLVTDGFYAKVIFLNLHNTISGHRTGLGSGNNEPYVGVFEYSLGCGGTTALFDTDGTTYTGLGWGDEATSGIDAYSVGSPGVSQGSVATVQPNINGAGLSNNPDFPEPSQYVSPSFTSDPSGFTPYPAYFVDPNGASVVVAIIPYNSMQAFGVNDDLHYAFKFTTTDDYGDDEELIYSLIVHEDGTYTHSLFEPTIAP